MWKFIVYKVWILFLLFLQPTMAQKEFSVSNISKHLNYLASDLFEGRGSGTLGGDLASKYIALHMNKYNLSPLGHNSTYYQYVPMHGTTPVENSKLIISADKLAKVLTIEDDFKVYHSGGKIYPHEPIKMVFVGYGITAPEYDYDDYENFDVENKIVVFIEGEPVSEFDENFTGEHPTIYSSPEAKQRIALAHGAVGSILLPLFTCTTKEEWENYNKQFDFEDVSLAYNPSPYLGLIINPNNTDFLFRQTGIQVNILRSFHKTGQIKSFYLESEIKVDVKFQQRDFVSPNIVGYIKGRDDELNDSYIVVSAHYDHLGIGPAIKQDSIYNGFMDNAIGCAAALELARTFSDLNSPPKRSIIFLFVTGEEKGLLGSNYFLDNSPIPLNSIIANLNIDGFAVFDEFESIVGIGSEYSTLSSTLELTAITNGLKIIELPKQFSGSESFSRSDQVAFAQKGIPSILIADGIDYKNISTEQGLTKMFHYMDNIYHTPIDDDHQEINFNAALQHLDLLYDFIKILANSPDTPKWEKNSPYQRLR